MRNYKRYKVILIGAIMTFIVVCGVGYANRGALSAWGYDVFLSKRVEASFKDSYKPLEGRPVPSEAPKVQDPFSMLLLGVDARDSERGRSDTLIYTVIRPKDGNVLMISIPRDTYADIAGKDRKDKITHAYAYGGEEMAVDTVAELLDTTVDHYASIDFQGFVKVVDTMGGIPLPVTKDLVNDDRDHEKFVVKANQDKYAGVDALNFVRYREDAGGDMSRTERNRQFLEALTTKAKSMNQWKNIPEMLDIVGENFETDLPPQSMTALAKQFLQRGHHIQSYTLKGEGKRMGPQHLWYYVSDDDDLSQVRATIAAWLDASTPTSELTISQAENGDQEPAKAKYPA